MSTTTKKFSLLSQVYNAWGRWEQWHFQSWLWRAVIATVNHKKLKFWKKRDHNRHILFHHVWEWVKCLHSHLLYEPHDEVHWGEKWHFHGLLWRTVIVTVRIEGQCLWAGRITVIISFQYQSQHLKPKVVSAEKWSLPRGSLTLQSEWEGVRNSGLQRFHSPRWSFALTHISVCPQSQNN